MKDLVVLVADKNMEFLMRGLLPRIPKIEQIHEFNFEPLVHPYRDPGIYNDAHDFLRSFTTKYSYAIVILDRIGCGRENNTRDEIETHIENKLFQSGWKNRACAIAIDPELENWIWVNEAKIIEAISWENTIGIYDWLHKNNLKDPGTHKPKHPKEAFEATLKICQTPRSSSIYKEISSLASYKQCQDPAFNKMMTQIKEWFTIPLS